MSKRDEFLQKVTEVKEASKEMIKTLDELIASQVDGKVKLPLIDETISVQAIHKMKDKVNEIIDKEITPEDYPTLEGIDRNLIIEFSPYDELVDDLRMFSFEVYFEEETDYDDDEEDDDFSDIEFINIDELD